MLIIRVCFLRRIVIVDTYKSKKTLFSTFTNIMIFIGMIVLQVAIVMYRY